jgi:hypothetical protein
MKFVALEGAAPISKETRTHWAEKALEYLLTHPEEHSYTISSGDSMIVATVDEVGYVEVVDVLVRRTCIARVTTTTERKLVK